MTRFKKFKMEQNEKEKKKKEGNIIFKNGIKFNNYIFTSFWKLSLYDVFKKNFENKYRSEIFLKEIINKQKTKRYY